MKDMIMTINPFEEHPRTPLGIGNATMTPLVHTADVLNAIDEAIFMNFEERAEDTASYVSVDNTLRLLKHTVEDLARE